MASAVLVRDVMTPNPMTVPADSTVADAARRMRDADIGDVIVAEGGRIRGIVTDRDLVVRAVAADRAPGTTTIGEICSGQLVTVGPQDRVDAAVQLMREHAVRRLPVVDADRVVGVVSLGDLAIDRDEKSALADISAAEANR